MAVRSVQGRDVIVGYWRFQLRDARPTPRVVQSARSKRHGHALKQTTYIMYTYFQSNRKSEWCYCSCTFPTALWRPRKILTRPWETVGLSSAKLLLGMKTSCNFDMTCKCIPTCLSKLVPVWHIPLRRVQWKTPDDGQRNCPKHVKFYSKNKFEKLVPVPSWSCSQAVNKTCMTYTIAVCTAKKSWWWIEELSETCRVLFQK